MNKDYFLKKLSINRPSVFESYNYDHLPAIFLAHDVVPIECYQHGLFYQKAYGHMQGSGCQICGQLTASNARALTTDEFIAKSTKRFGERFDYEKTVYVRREVALTLTCRRHGDIELTPLQHDWSKHGCAQCDVEVPKLIRMRKVLDKAKKIHGDKYDYSRVTFANVNDKMEIVCPHHGAFWQSLYDHTGKGAGCPHCARENDKLTIDSFVTKARAIHGNQYGYSQVKYETNASMVTITCPKHGDFIQRAASHLAGSKCKACHVELARLPAEEFIKNAKAVHGTTYDYSKVNYHGNKTPVEIICSIHGSFWQKPNSHVASKCGCRSCSESNGEKAVESFLKKYGINHIREYRMLPYRYRADFYLPELNTYIEFNGLQHYKPIEFFGGLQGYLSMQKRDEAKRVLIKQNGGKLIVITYLCSTNDSVEIEMIRRLKKIYARWYLVEGKLRVFKTVGEVYSTFNIPLSTLVRHLDLEVMKTVKNSIVLF